MDWRKELREIETVEEFERSKRRLSLSLRKNREIAGNISVPDILRTFLLEYQVRMRYRTRNDMKRKSIRFFYEVWKRQRINLMEVFFAEGYLDFPDLIEEYEWRSVFLRSIAIVIRVGIADVTLYFLEKGMDANMLLGGSDFTLLSFGCFFSKIDIVKLFLEHGANPNVEVSRSTGPVKYAVNRCDDVCILDNLIMHGANLHDRSDLWDDHGWKTYDGRKKDIFQRLADHNVLPSKELYLSVVTLSKSNPHLKDIVTMMREALERNKVSYGDNDRK